MPEKRNMRSMKDRLQLIGAAGFIGLASFGAHSLAESSVIAEARGECLPVEVSVYYAPGSTDLNEFAERVLNNAMFETEHCELAAVQVFGYADASGNAEANLVISRKRAEAVKAYLEMRGVNPNVFTVEAKGEEGAIDANGKAEVMRRKTDLRLIPVADVV